MSLRTAHAAIPRLAVSMIPETPNESGEVCKMRGRDLDGHRQMLQAECLRPQVAEDLSNASFLSAREHGRYARAGSAADGLTGREIRAPQEHSSQM